jgi:hypothetical protein
MCSFPGTKLCTHHVTQTCLWHSKLWGQASSAFVLGWFALDVLESAYNLTKRKINAFL